MAATPGGHPMTPRTTPKQDRKYRVGELIQDLSKSQNFEAMAIKELLEIMLDDAAHQMVECDPNDLNRLQGEARAFRKLYLMLTRPPVSARQEIKP